MIEAIARYLQNNWVPGLDIKGQYNLHSFVILWSLEEVSYAPYKDHVEYICPITPSKKRKEQDAILKKECLEKNWPELNPRLYIYWIDWLGQTRPNQEIIKRIQRDVKVF